MSMFRIILIAFILSGSVAHAATSSKGMIGINAGIGLPFVQQLGVNFFASDMLSISGGYNLLDVSSGEASVKLSMPEILLNFHPFSGGFFVGAGIGKETLEVTATEQTTGQKVEVDVEATTTIVKLGWMFGSANGGFWYGIDFSYIMPSSSEVTINAPGVPVTDDAYVDAIEAGEKFGEEAYANITFARFGWIF